MAVTALYGAECRRPYVGEEQRRLYLPGNADQVLVVPGGQHVTKDAWLRTLAIPAEPAAIRIGWRD